MGCAYGEPAKDCAILHWCPKLGGRAEANGWRAPCLLCGAPRAIEYEVHGKGLRWNSFCAEHDRDTLRPYMRDLLGGCLPGKSAGHVAAPDLAALALSGLPPMAMKVRLLEMSGMGTDAALDKLGVDRTSRYRIRQQLSQFCDKPAGNSRR